MRKILIALICVFFASCGSNTSIVSSWKDPNATLSKEQFKKVLVVALAKDESTRRATENRIASINPTVLNPSFNYLNQQNLNLTQEQKISIVQSEGFDGAITLRFIRADKQTEYVPGTSNYYGGMGYPGMGYGYVGGYGMGYGAGFGGWYGAYAPAYYTPGYYQENVYYYIETNIFDLKNNKLVWSATTKSLDVSDINTTVDEIMEACVQQMRADGYMDPKAKK
ncbi:hypothetical protein [Flavobacterium sp. 5]|uniref:hypothetical protein n=1 Tax=Flavobacterium sp. 5 TaxID=2035199 RepID=UPI000C2BCC36|nr:hypothetical protein [Flavobacterium sp. 5]PKB18185.1 hypothetical protein CLU82_3446 [Flavobacterium sp. 5]